LKGLNMAGWSKSAGSKAAGKSKGPAKEISHMTVKKAANGGHIMTHHHTHPEHHPDETHTTKGDDQMVGHMMDNMGTPNAGEDPNAAAAPQAGAPPMAGGGAAPAAAPQAGAPPAAM
jgi:hypothetical protein